jgi:3-hydroxyisobutyrate dehydrogenase-like beta-hydroxyacid dehydrogenase
MTECIVGVISPGHMGAGLGWALAEGGARVVTTIDGRSERTARLAAEAGLTVLPDVADVLAGADVVLVVTPPAAAVAAAAAIAAAARRADRRPLVVDLNAVSPVTVGEIGRALDGLDLVDGAISGPPPTVRPGARVYLSGPRAAEVAALPWRHVTASVVGTEAGSASALKMSTASVYKGLVALYAQALRSAAYHGVVGPVVDDLAGSGHDLVRAVAVAATKADRFVGEMHEIAATQRAAGLPPELFEAFAAVYADLAGTDLARDDPESVPAAVTADAVLARLVRAARQ